MIQHSVRHAVVEAKRPNLLEDSIMYSHSQSIHAQSEQVIDSPSIEGANK